MKKCARELKKKRCLKVMMYVYLPEDAITWRGLRFYAMSHGHGRINIYDEFNRKTDYSPAFGNLGQAMMLISREYSRRSRERIRTKA